MFRLGFQKFFSISIETAGFGKVKSVVEGDLTAIGNISETMDGGGGGAGRRDGAAKQGSFAQGDDDDDDEEDNLSGTILVFVATTSKSSCASCWKRCQDIDARLISRLIGPKGTWHPRSWQRTY